MWKNKVIVGFYHVTNIWILDASTFFKNGICFQESNKRWCITDVWCMKDGVTLIYHGSQKWDVSLRTWAVVARKTVIYSQVTIRALNGTFHTFWVVLVEFEFSWKNWKEHWENIFLYFLYWFTAVAKTCHNLLYSLQLI